MKTKNAVLLNSLILDAISTCDKYLQRNKESELISDTEKEKYGSEAFLMHFDNFADELRNNFKTYNNYNLIENYLNSVFCKLANIISYGDDRDQYIIDNAYEVEFLIELKTCINFYIKKVQDCLEMRFIMTPLSIPQVDSNVSVQDTKSSSNKSAPSEPEYEPELQFNFNGLKAECDQLASNFEKINLITDRLFDFEQWQLQYDTLIHDKDLGNYYELTAKYYPKFENLCAIELRRINKMIEIENRINTKTPTITEQTPSPYKWNSTDTDFLELFAALYQNQSIVRTDGKSLTRKEMLEYFQSLLGLEIKDAEVKLNRAGNRNDNTAFMDKLAQAFRNFVDSKETKLIGRK